ncbi:EF-hand domain-containing protein [Aerolutibacter ruishenii]|uniref:EF-hand domain-containing protein n=1 Tax=Aerolutibacter ruishenii TaxID=686800 RepID=A0A562LV33_9GAMM|nr:EF-hand domain-containing protein [Lysobacter ruishenii]TWI11509.1 hypothetical protein IP93_01405 [Lysobacter ruishenii]
MKIARQPVAFVFAIAVLVSTLPARSSGLQDDERASPPVPPAPTTCTELAALGDTVDLTSREVGTLKQRCDLEDIRAKFAQLDRNQDGYLSLEELPMEHTLSQHFADVDFDGDKRLSLAEVAEHDAETHPIE